MQEYHYRQKSLGCEQVNLDFEGRGEKPNARCLRPGVRHPY